MTQFQHPQTARNLTAPSAHTPGSADQRAALEELFTFNRRPDSFNGPAYLRTWQQADPDGTVLTVRVDRDGFEDVFGEACQHVPQDGPSVLHVRLMRDGQTVMTGVSTTCGADLAFTARMSASLILPLLRDGDRIYTLHEQRGPAGANARVTDAMDVYQIRLF